MYELTALFMYKIQFMAELLIIEMMMFCYCKRKEKFVLRFLIGVVVSFIFALAVPIFAYNALYSMVMFIGLAGFTVLVSKFCLEEKIFTIIFIVVTSYALQHIAHQLYELMVSATGLNGNVASGSYMSDKIEFDFNPFVQLLYFATYLIVYCAGFLLIANRYIKNFKKLRVKQMSLFVIAFFIIVFAIILSLVMTYLSHDNYFKAYSIIVYIYDIFSCILALFIQYEVAMREQLVIDYNTMSHLYYKEQEQFDVMKKNINLINMKCHDLKHQIRVIGQQSSVSNEALKEMEEVISIYDSAVKTGNEAIDIILTEKSLYCNKHGIKLSCIIDGKRLDFMSHSDIYSLFGNLVDNAIEAVINLEKPQRKINVYVKAIKRMLSINVQNHYQNELQFDSDNTIKTSKKDKDYHGFGIKSIKFVCERYDGNMSISTNDNIFDIHILIPMP